MLVIQLHRHVVFSSMALAFLSNMGEKCKFISPSEIQVKIQPETIRTEEKLDVKSQPEKGE
jgi:hypothetical protein